MRRFLQHLSIGALCALHICSVAYSFTIPSSSCHIQNVAARSKPALLLSDSLRNENTDENRNSLKQNLLQSIRKLRQIEKEDGDISIDFGVKGGELNATTRAPQKVDYYQISEAAGKTADNIFELCSSLAQQTPLSNPTEYLGDKLNGTQAPLHGTWKLLFTTAADASFSKNSTRGDAKARNVVDGVKGRITNVIEFLPNSSESGSKDRDGKTTIKDPVVKQLNVVIQAIASSPTRVNLTFRYVRVQLTKLFFLPIRWSLYIPVPGPFLTKCIVFLNRFVAFWKRNKTIKEPPKAYFDILYLDDQLRIHKTGQDNLFVQAKDTWEEARPLLE